MKIYRVSLTATFIISLLAGFSAGTYFFREKNTSRPTNASSPQPTNIPGAQESIWLIAVDRLNQTAPRLEGIWLLAYIPNYTSIKPFPLYPSDNFQHDTELASAFKLTAGRKIAPEFWDFLQKHNHPGRNYIVFDEVAAASIINVYGGVTIEGRQLSGLEAITQIPKIWDDPQGSLRGQVAIMDSVCKSVFEKRSAFVLDDIEVDVGKHIVSNLDLGKKSKEWQSMILNGNKKVCDFSDFYKKIQLTSKP
jgi:hypothetical protein